MVGGSYFTSGELALSQDEYFLRLPSLLDTCLNFSKPWTVQAEDSAAVTELWGTAKISLGAGSESPVDLQAQFGPSTP